MKRNTVEFSWDTLYLIPYCLYLVFFISFFFLFSLSCLDSYEHSDESHRGIFLSHGARVGGIAYIVDLERAMRSPLIRMKSRQKVINLPIKRARRALFSPPRLHYITSSAINRSCQRQFKPSIVQINRDGRDACADERRAR